MPHTAPGPLADGCWAGRAPSTGPTTSAPPAPTWTPGTAGRLEDALAAYVRGEDDHDVPGPDHGHDGPVPVERPAGRAARRAHDADRARRRRARRARRARQERRRPARGRAWCPANVSHGTRVNAAMAYVLPHRDRPNLTVRGDCPVARVLFEGDRAVGVETPDGERIEAGEVVLAAGAIPSPHLLALSGIGPADELRAAGVPVRLDRPGVGHGWSDHPAVFLGFAYDESLHPEAVSAQAAVHLDAGTLDADPARRPGGGPRGPALLPAVRARRRAPPDVRGAAARQPRRRGARQRRPAGASPAAPPLSGGGTDRARMRAVVRFAAELLALGRHRDPDTCRADTDAELDAWVRRR